MDREKHPEGRSPPGLAFDFDPASVSFDDSLDDVQTQTDSRDPLRVSRSSSKRFEDMRDIFPSYSDAGIRNRYQRLLRGLAETNINRASVR